MQNIYTYFSLAAMSIALIGGAQAISIKPDDFDRLIMPCYTGQYAPAMASASYGLSQPPVGPSNYMQQQQRPPGYQSQASYLGSAQNSSSSDFYNQASGPRGSYPLGSSSDYQSTSSSRYQSGASPYSGGYPSSSSGGFGGQAGYSSLSSFGQEFPRASTMDNFIAILGKLEASQPRLATNIDQLIRMLLDRFRLDNYYFDVRSRRPIAVSQDFRGELILSALLNPGGQQYSDQAGGQFPEHLLSHDEKCSMYFMLSHFIDEASLRTSPLASTPVAQLTGPQGGQLPPYLQAAGSRYPVRSADSTYGAGASASGIPVGGGAGIGTNGPPPGALGVQLSPSGGQRGRYSGPSPSFGSPETRSMNSFGQGIVNNPPEYPSSAGNPLGVNTLQQNPNLPQYSPSSQRSFNSYTNNDRFFSGGGNQRFPPGTSIDGGARSTWRNANDDNNRQGFEYGVVSVGEQENAAVALSRVLLGILAVNVPRQTVGQLAQAIYPTQATSSSSRLADELDPAFAATLADLWAVAAIPQPGKSLDIRLSELSGHWNDTICPISFKLDRASAVTKFTQAELLGGIDGFALGLLRRRLLSMGKQIKLSEMLRLYYSKAGFRPQFSEVTVCNRQSAISSSLDELHRQAESYLRLHELSLPISDMEISRSINGLSMFRDILRQAANQGPPGICQDTSQDDSGFTSGGEQCEIAKTDLVAVLDTSGQANRLFMNMFLAKLAGKLGLSRDGSSLTIATDQLDSYSEYKGLNVLVRNSTNNAEIGCALTHDNMQTIMGNQITEPVKLMSSFERSLIQLDSEYLTRSSLLSSQQYGSSSYQPANQPSYVSTLGSMSSASSYNSGNNNNNGYGSANVGRDTGGAKVILWFNFGGQVKSSSIANQATNWLPESQREYNSGNGNQEYRFYEAKRLLRENFRGASIVAVASNREDVKAFVYDEERDIITENIPASGYDSGSAAPAVASSSIYPAVVASDVLAMVTPADALVGKVLQRLCDVPATFQYAKCFRGPSEGAEATGYISPGRKQYWMMAPKTFFASQTVKMLFRVEGGRLRVCFGRQARPDETAQRYGGSGAGRDYISAASSQSGNNYIAVGPNGQPLGDQNGRPNLVVTSSSSTSGGNYYTGMDNGICKDVGPSQLIDFVVDTPCYKKSIAECEPFYFVIKEISNGAEADPGYMCRGDGCKRFDQVKFTMIHSGVVCSSARRLAQASWLLISVACILVTSALLPGNQVEELNQIKNKAVAFCVKQSKPLKTSSGLVAAATTASVALAMLFCCLASLPATVSGQQAGVNDFGEGRQGEQRGSYTPNQWLSIVLLVMIIIAGLALAIGFCYYIIRRNSRGHSPIAQHDRL